jgi:enoyl-CoA hydratase/carnithine racemase
VSTNETLLVERRDGAMWVTLNRPERLNAISPKLADEFADVIASLHDDRTTRVLVLTGAGRAFCAGLDLKEHQSGESDGTGLARLAEIVLGLRSIPQPVIALVNGAAAGGGLAFALAADVRLAGESARFSAAFVNLGLTGCELGTSYFLPRQVGTSITAELLLTGRFLSAERALRCGLVSEVVADDQLVAAGAQLVDEMLRLSPAGLRLGKATMQRTLPVDDLAEVIELEGEGQAICAKGPNMGEAIRAFAERRPPVYVAELEGQVSDSN